MQFIVAVATSIVTASLDDAAATGLSSSSSLYPVCTSRICMWSSRSVGQCFQAAVPVPGEPLVAILTADPEAGALLSERLVPLQERSDELNALVPGRRFFPGHPWWSRLALHLSPMSSVQFVTSLSGLHRRKTARSGSIFLDATACAPLALVAERDRNLDEKSLCSRVSDRFSSREPILECVRLRRADRKPERRKSRDRPVVRAMNQGAW